MGANQSTGGKKPTSNISTSNTPVKRNKSLKRTKSVRGETGYFLVKFKKKQIKIVNSDTAELISVEKIVR